MTQDRKSLQDTKTFSRHQIIAQRLICTEKLISILAHVIRNPLNAIKGAAILLNPKVAQDDHLKRLLNIILEEVDHMGAVMNDLHAISQENSSQRHPVDLHALIEDVLMSFKDQLDALSITIETDYDQGLRPLLINHARIYEALSCLITNALDAMPKGGRLAVTTRFVESSDCVVLRIRDDGHGIIAENMEKLCEPLFTTKPKGYGVGLSVVYQTAMKHGGTVDIESQVDKGTTVMMTLPIKKT